VITLEEGRAGLPRRFGPNTKMQAGFKGLFIEYGLK
jgi:hypothetical protein